MMPFTGIEMKIDLEIWLKLTVLPPVT